MAGLASYVRGGALSDEGIARACDALSEFRQILELLNIYEASVFATASLRNVSNTREALEAIEAATGYDIEILSGEEEALLGYMGAMEELSISEGVFTDVGGASTEVVIFKDGIAQKSKSFAVGSLSLYRNCVKEILPDKGSRIRIESMLKKEIDGEAAFGRGRFSPMIGVGGTSRAVLRMAKKFFDLPDNSNSMTAQQLDILYKTLCREDRKAIDLILWTGAERIHTLVPGMMILRHVLNRFGSDALVVSKYGLREGYLCQKLLRKDINTRKTES
jgi:exopolyphosphatase/guanosine-5'-triphosphate,3'-diphosphate pyrophosphatase